MTDRQQQHKSEGFALIAALLMLFLLSVISAGMIYVANSETRAHTSDLEGTQAYYANEAAMEKMMTDLANLYLSNQSPTVAQIQALGSAPPSLTGFSFPEYQFTVPSSGGNPVSTTRTISSGANQGLIAQIVPITLTATARKQSGAEVRMTRDIEIAQIPVFQFGMFSDSDLSYFPGPGFDFAGRVHTNGNLFIATTSTTPGLVFHSKVAAAKELIRAELSNGVNTTSSGRTGPILIPAASQGCDGSRPNCRDLQENEGSKVGSPTSADNTNWNNISTNLYKGWVVNGKTGAKALTLPFVSAQLRPIEIIRRPPPGESSSSSVSRSRLYNLAQIRVLLNDDPAELPGGTGDSENVPLANLDPYAAGVPVVGASNTYFAEATWDGTATPPFDSDWIPPANGITGWPLIAGYLRVESRQSNGAYIAVTRQWLELGVARGLTIPNNVHPNAILTFQLHADRNGDGDLLDIGESSALITGPAAKHNWHPINLYDTREGEVRDVANNSSVALGGIVNVVELDVNNLRRWLTGTIGTTGAQTENSSQNGYILYFSDRRGMLPSATGQKVGEYGFEDVINPSASNGSADGVLASAEDVNQNGSLEVYGKQNLGDGFISAAQGGDTANDNPMTRISPNRGRKNRVSGTRHALKLVNGSLGNLPTKPDGSGGFTVASENPVYVLGNYNANGGGFGNPHAAAAVIADAVTLLSNNWRDWRSFNSPTSPGSRSATTTWYRMAVAAGKNLSFPKPIWGGPEDFGTDGGTHNFLRYLESWSGQTLNYQGSLASLFFSEYAVGIYKCCNTVYSPPTRNYSFDTEFLDPAKLPPGTPRFTDVVNLGYRQVFAP